MCDYRHRHPPDEPPALEPDPLPPTVLAALERMAAERLSHPALEIKLAVLARLRHFGHWPPKEG